MRLSRLALAALPLVFALPLFAQGRAPKLDDKQVVAVVNGIAVTRAELADELIQRRGKAHLEAMINRRIIEQACKQAGITVTEREVEDDLRELMRSQGFTSATEFEKHMVKPMMHISLPEYKDDVLKQGILTRRLAANSIKVTEEELKKAFDAKFGERVQCRIIIEKSLRAATDMHGKIAGNRLNFMQAARQQSNADLARFAGQIPPIGRWTSGDDVEKRAFELQDGEVSEVLQLPQGGFAILLRENAVPPDTTKNFNAMKADLQKEVTEAKINQVVPRLVAELKQKSVVENYLGNQSASLKSILEKLEQK